MLPAVTTGRLVLVAIATSVFPGFGQGMVSRRWMAAWAVLGVLSVAANLISIWLCFLPLAIRLTSAIDAFVRVRRATRCPREDLAAAGIDRVPARFGRWTFPAIAVVIGTIGIGFARLSVQGFKVPSTSMCPTLLIGDHIYVDKLTVRWRAPERGEIIVFWQPCEVNRSYINRVIAIAGDTVEIRCSVLHINGQAVASALLQGGDGCTYRDHDDFQDFWYERSCSRYRETIDGRSYEVLHFPFRPDLDAKPAALPHREDHKDFPELAGSPRTCADANMAATPANQKSGEIVVTKPEASPCELQMHFVVPPDSLFVLGDNRANSNDSRYWGSVPVGYVKGRITGIWLPIGRTGSVE